MKLILRYIVGELVAGVVGLVRRAFVRSPMRQPPPPLPAPVLPAEARHELEQVGRFDGDPVAQLYRCSRCGRSGTRRMLADAVCILGLIVAVGVTFAGLFAGLAVTAAPVLAADAGAGLAAQGGDELARLLAIPGSSLTSGLLLYILLDRRIGRLEQRIDLALGMPVDLPARARRRARRGLSTPADGAGTVGGTVDPLV